MNKLTVLIFAALVAGGAFAATIKYVGSNPNESGYDNDWNAAKDAKGNDMWNGGGRPTPENDYLIGTENPWVWFKIVDNEGYIGRFLGKSLTISCKDVDFIGDGNRMKLVVNNLTLNAGSLLKVKTTYGFANSPHGLWLTGTPQINGTLRLIHIDAEDAGASGYLSGNLTGQGLIQFRGENTSTPRLGPNWRIEGDNSDFMGKFVFMISQALNGGEAYATGVEISNANALGGARDSFTPDAVEIKSWNGLVTVGSDITLNAENCGILMQTNSFFEVPANRVLTVAEPIRMTGGFFKKGAGTLALTGGFSFGSDGNAAADGVNSMLTVKEGILRVTSANDLANLDVTMASGTTLELVGTTTATFRSLSAAGVLKVVVDCTGLTPGSTQTITLNMPRLDAEALVEKVDVMAKGSYATIGSDLTLTSTGITVTLKVPSVTVWHTYTGNGGYSNYNTSWNAIMDGDDPSKYLWDNNLTDVDHLAAVGTDGYIINPGWWDVFIAHAGRMFNGGALHVKTRTLEVSLEDYNQSIVVSNLTVDVGAKFKVECRYHDQDKPTYLLGDLWRVDGTLEICPLNPSGYLCPKAPIIGSGLVSYGGWGWKAKALDQRLESDNSHFRGKFKVSLPNTPNGAEMAAGLRIVDARALGGALGVMTPDALTLEANNGLIAGQTLTLDAENRGILMKQGAYFEVESGKTLMLKEPIRVVNGILKKGSGTLAIGGDVTIGEDGATSPNGTNNKLTVQAGTIKAGSTNGIAKLAFEFASGTKMEVDAFPTDDGVASAGFYLAGDTPFTAADAKIPMNIAFPDGYKIEEDVNVVLCTVKSTNVDSVMNRITITTTGLVRKGLRSFWTEDAGNGLTRIGYKFERTGLLLIVE